MDTTRPPVSRYTRTDATSSIDMDTHHKVEHARLGRRVAAGVRLLEERVHLELRGVVVQRRERLAERDFARELVCERRHGACERREGEAGGGEGKQAAGARVARGRRSERTEHGGIVWVC